MGFICMFLHIFMRTKIKRTSPNGTKSTTIRSAEETVPYFKRKCSNYCKTPPLEPFWRGRRGGIGEIFKLLSVNFLSLMTNANNIFWRSRERERKLLKGQNTHCYIFLFMRVW